MIKDLFDIIGPNVGTETGNDDFVYGNYVEWPKLEELEDDILLRLMEYFGIESEYDIDSEKEDIIKRLEELEVPTQTAYEYDYSMPEEQKYWYEEDYDWDYYSSHAPNIYEYNAEIDNIKEILLGEVEQEIKAMYLFRAFVLTENFQKSMVYSKLPNLESCITNNELLKYVEIDFKKQLNTSKGRFKLYKLFSGSKLGKIPNVEIRNLLAHELDKVRVGEIISYEIDDVTERISLEVLISELKEYCLNIE